MKIFMIFSLITFTFLGFLLIRQVDLDQSDLEVRRPLPEPGPPLGGADWQRQFFTDWHEPYGAVLDAEVEDSIWEDIGKLPSDKNSRTVNSWILVGPSGMLCPDGALQSGRVLDLDALGGPGTTVAAASGGLWQYDFLFPVPLTDEVTSQWIGSFAIDPHDENTIIIGTGEHRVRNGTGLWKSTDGGTNWVHKTMDPQPSAFCRVRYGRDGAVVHTATNQGYYRSTDGGETWTRTLAGITTDLALPPDSNVLYMSVHGEGLYVTFDAGVIWSKATNAVIPTSEVTRGAVTVCDADPGVIYAAFVDDDSESMRGVYKTTNYGYTWTDVSPPDDYMAPQGWYNNVIAVSPTDPNFVLAGGVRFWRTQDGGVNWERVMDPDLHADYHALQWHPDGLQVWVGHDGGWSYSNNRGLDYSWTSSSNYLPITQFVEIDAAGINWNSGAVLGGSQDNGVSLTYDGGETWNFVGGMDGGGVEFGHQTIFELYRGNGFYMDGLKFHREYSPNSGVDWIDFSEGIHDSGIKYPKIRIGRTGILYTHSAGWVYRREPGATSWVPEMGYQFGYNVSELTVSTTPGDRVLYVCLGSSTAWRMYVKEGESWHERSGGLPAGHRVRKVVPHPSNNWWAYALMDGLGTPGQKIFFTANRGESWVNITGNLPNVPLSDLVVHPNNSDRLYVGSAYGCYRTEDTGDHWQRWNNGMPEATVVTELKTVDMQYFGQGFHIVAATYGRSIWRRDISGEDHVSAVADMPAGKTVAITNAAPNPFNPATTISFHLSVDGPVKLKIFDIHGRLVRTLLEETRGAGEHLVQWDGRDSTRRRMASGVYLARIEAGGGVDSRKIVMAQ